MKQVNMLALKQDKKNEVETEWYVVSARVVALPGVDRFLHSSKIHCSLEHQSIVKADSWEYNDEKKKEYLFIYMEVSRISSGLLSGGRGY
jgi:hypothetical protein